MEVLEEAMGKLPKWTGDTVVQHDCAELKLYNSYEAARDPGEWPEVFVVFYEGEWKATDFSYEGNSLDNISHCPFCGTKLSSIAS